MYKIKLGNPPRGDEEFSGYSRLKKLKSVPYLYMYEGLTTHLTNRTTLTKKEQLILLYFSSFRFLTAKLLQQLMNQKDIRFIRSWLHHLVNLGFIKVINTSEVETLYKAAIYCLTPSSRSLLIKHSFLVFFNNLVNFSFSFLLK